MKKQNAQRFYYCLVFCLFFSAQVRSTFASSVFISEVYPAPNSSEVEWIEIANPNSQIATISGWMLYDQLSNPSLIYSIVSAEILPWETISFDLATTKLNNSGDAAVLYNESGTEIDRFTFGSTSQGKSWHKNSQTAEPYLDVPTKNSAILLPSANPTLNQNILIQTITPSTQLTVTLVPSSTVTINNEIDTSSISITEVMACPPSGQQEWVELFNFSETAQTIDDWYITDSQGTKIYLAGSIQAKSLKDFVWNRSILNNQGDSISLYTENDVKITTIVLPQCVTGESYALFSGVFTYTDTPTPGEDNQRRTQATDYPAASPDNIPTPEYKQLSVKPSTSVSDSTNSTNIFSPALPSVTLERITTVYQQLSNQLQIIKTPKPHALAWCGVIISCIIFLIAYYYLHATN